MELGTQLGTNAEQTRNNNKNVYKGYEGITNNIVSLFDYWMSKNLVKHRSMTPHIELQIKYKLQQYSVDELADAINNYDLILNDGNYKLSTRWGIADFLGKDHYEKFLSDRDPFNYYPKVNNAPAVSNQRQSKFNKNKNKLLQGGGGGDGARGERVIVQSVGSLPEPD